MKGLKVDHVGYVTNSLETKKAELAAVLGWGKESRIWIDPVQKVRVIFLEFANVRLELVEPTSSDSPISKYLDKKGEGLHHIAYLVPDALKALAKYKSQGFEVAQDIWAAPAFNGRKVFFLHPRSTGHLLMEFIEEPKA